ncbi:MAG: c-type cytochrome [Woeseiaceae bacterium]
MDKLPLFRTVFFVVMTLAVSGASVAVAVGEESAADDPSAQESIRAAELFAQHCASCHGQDGRGRIGIPDLTDGAWRYGGTAQQIAESILNGRSGLMPGLGIPLGEEGVDQVVAYVLSLSNRSTATPEQVTAGRQQFNIYCASCHGQTGEGTITIGAPDLTDDIWIHGDTEAEIRDVIQNGRSAVMPAYATVLDNNSVVTMTAYLLEIENKQPKRSTGTQSEMGAPSIELVQ